MYRKALLRLSGNENKPNRAERFVAGALAGPTLIAGDACCVSAAESALQCSCKICVCMLLYGSSFAVVLHLVALFFMPLDAVQPCLGCDARLYVMCFIHTPVTSAVKVYRAYQQHVASCIGAGVTSTVTCFPLDVMRTRVMGPGGHVYGGVLSTFKNLLQKEGISSLYVGLLPAVISMAPAGAVFYGVYDLLKVPFRLHHAH